MTVPSSPARTSSGQARYWRQIWTVLMLKALGFTLIYLLCFGPWNSKEPSVAAMARHLISPAATDAAETAHD